MSEVQDANDTKTQKNVYMTHAEALKLETALRKDDRLQFMFPKLDDIGGVEDIACVSLRDVPKGQSYRIRPIVTEIATKVLGREVPDNFVSLLEKKDLPRSATPPSRF